MLSHADHVTAKERVADDLLARPGVRYVGLGGRERAGRPVPESVIKVFVERKRPAAQLPAGQLIPAEVDGIPTDVVDLSEEPADDGPATPPRWPGGRLRAESDKDETTPELVQGTERVKVLMGGIMVSSDAAQSGTSSANGTIGCFFRDTTDPSIVYLVSNHHVLGQRVGTDNADITTKIRHPHGPDDILCSCCSNRIGRFYYGARNGVVDAALARLDPGTKWTADNIGIGPITGVHEFTVQQLTTVPAFDVWKWGIRTRGTGGMVRAINVQGKAFGGKGDTITYKNLILVKANPPEPGITDYCFSQEGDSGASIVDSAGKAVGLVVSGIVDTDTDEVKQIPRDPGEDPPILNRWTLAIPMKDILDYFTTVQHLPVALATATEFGQINVVPEAPKHPALAMVAPELAPALSAAAAPADAASVKRWLPGVTPPDTATLSRLREDLANGAAGRRLLDLWSAHGTELTGLVDGNRRVAVAWHRTGGAGLFQLLIRMANNPELVVPATLNGVPVAECVDRVIAGFTRFASPELQAALAEVRKVLPDPAGLSYLQLLAALTKPTTADDIVAIIDRERAGLLARDGVLYVGVGHKEVDDLVTDQLAIKVYVRHKATADGLAADQLIPAEFDGVPTDVVDTAGGPRPAAAQLPPGVLDPGKLDTNADEAKILIGGYRIGMFDAQTTKQQWGTATATERFGTLGCILVDSATHSTPYGLTNEHVANGEKTFKPIPGKSEAGQPTGETYSIFCSDSIGFYGVGTEQPAPFERDEAVIRIVKRPWAPEIRGLGKVTGKHTLEPEDYSDTVPYNVRKFGARTGLTGGTATLVPGHAVGDRLMIVKPRPNPKAAPGQTTYFLVKGDSGAVLVNDLGTTRPDGLPVLEVIGLLYQFDDNGNGYALHIDDVLSRLKKDGIDLDVATVDNARGSAVTAEPALESERFRTDLAASPAGRAVTALWQDHQDELTSLVRSNRRVLLLWRRGGGAALAQLLSRLPRDPAATVPTLIGDRPVDVVLDELRAGVAPYASPALRTALDKAHAAVPSLAGKTYAEILDALGRG
ncbi:hypothetical protein [Kutzneria chonburiensis]|uniref:Serine protease n=1 Tax=Kutzneria chonburiensis TaxID=1483604 RepID=A0ABV6MRP0_9PSEU|nr:hypothetical protein [Kutzneria chonburiensis]